MCLNHLQCVCRGLLGTLVVVATLDWCCREVSCGFEDSDIALEVDYQMLIERDLGYTAERT